MRIRKILKSGSAFVLVLHSSDLWWRIACLITDFYSFLPGNWLFSIHVRKCCNKLYLFKISYRSFRNLEKSLLFLFMKSYSLDKKTLFFKQLVSSLHNSFINFWDNGITAKHNLTHIRSGWKFNSLIIFHHKMLKFI